MTQGEILERRINIVQGEYKVSDDPAALISTLLGSCVAACIRDPVAGVGGMNHFLLPGEDARSHAHDAEPTSAARMRNSPSAICAMKV